MTKKRTSKTFLCLALLGTTFLASPAAARDLSTLSLKELTELEVVSVSKIPNTSYHTQIIDLQGLLWLTGDSTLHPFSSRTSTMSVSATLDPIKTAETPSVWDAILHKDALTQLQLTISVKDLKSKESALDKNMYKALKAETYPDILFRLAKYEVIASTVSAGASQIKTEGSVTIAGTVQPITLFIDALPQETHLRIQGHYMLLMTDFGIKPPTMMMGAIKVRNQIMIQFDLKLQVKEI